MSYEKTTQFRYFKQTFVLDTATAVMNAEYYNEKVHELLDQEASYSVLKKDPTKATERKLLLVLKDLHKEKKISDVFLRPYTTIGRLQ